MNDHRTTCDPQRIELFLEQKLSDEEQSVFESHLSSCGDCRQRLKTAAASEDIWAELCDSLRDERLPPDGLRSGDSDSTDEDALSGRTTVLKLLAPTDDDRMLGRWGTYEVVGVVGTGGMGVVLKAFDAALNRYVAIKVLAPHLGSSGAARKRFSREAQAAAAVVHDNVIEIYHVAETAGLPYLVMPYVRGPSLQRRLDDGGPMALAEILRVGMQAAAGLAAAHAQGLVHRDVKPANILLADGIERVKLADFGLARAADDASLTKTGVIAGTPQYLSPEQARGEAVDQRSDLFSLGSVLYAMCTGRAPFRAETSYGVLRRITDEEPRPIREINPEIPEWLCGIVAKLMAKRPDDRFQSAQEVAKLLEECLAHVQQPTAVPLPAAAHSPLPPGEGQGVRVAGAHKPRLFAGRSRRKRILAAVLGVLFVGVLGLASGILIHLKKDNKTTTLEVPEGSTDGPPLAVAPFDEATAREHQARWAKYLHAPVVQSNSIGMKLVLIPPGEFAMGSSKELIEGEMRLHGGDSREEKWYRNNLPGEGPQHRVRITKPFWLGATPVTQGEYERVTGSNPSKFPIKPSVPEYERVTGSNPSKFQRDPQRPVEQVSWDDAVEFCRKLSALPGEKAAKRRYGMPTEAQWEYACRAGTTTRWYMGDNQAGLFDVAWFNTNSGGQTHPVGGKKPNAWGLYDMHGSVWEWCRDWYDKEYYAWSPMDDPAGPPDGSFHAMRGGIWSDPARYCRSAFRNSDGPGGRYYGVGFRVSLVPADK